MEQNMDKENIYKELKEQLAGAEKVLVGIGGEWKIPENADPVRISEVREGYQQLYELIKEKDYFIVTTLTDGEIWETELNRDRIVAPCGNRHLYQCRSACVKEVWKETELSEKVCPHCKGPLVENTIQAENYVEEGYLPMWKTYQTWLSATLNRKLLVLELGEGFRTPTVIRWPFEKTAMFNLKSTLIRVNARFPQLTEQTGDRGISIGENALELFS